MSFFCLLWVPLFYLLRRSFVGAVSSSSGVWALVFGSIAATVQFFLGAFISPGGFGFNRWLFGFVDLISVLVLIPIFVYSVIFIIKGFTGDFADFSLLWMIPFGGLHAVDWSVLNDPVLLILVPVLWTALAAGISFFINWMATKKRWYTFAVSMPCILGLPVLAAATYWALFSQMTFLGFLFLFLMYVPVILSFIFERHNK